MGERLEAYEANMKIQKESNDRILAESSKIEQENIALESEILSIKERREENARKYSNFCSNVKEMLLSEALYSVLSGAVGESKTGEAIVRNYVKENGINNIFRNMGKTYALEMVQNKFNEYYDKILETVDKEDPSTYSVDVKDKIAFLDDLGKEKDIEEVKQAIALRVSNAEEEFITNNIADKVDMDSIVDDTKTRIESNKGGMDEETEKAVEQEAAMMSKRKINEIRENRTRSIFEQMVRNITSSSVKSDVLKEAYCKSNGAPDMAKIVESARQIYGFLETINTMKLEKVDEAYITNVLEELK